MSSFRDYLLFGWKLCNIPPGNKGPVGQAAVGWQKKARAIADPNLGPAMAGAGLLHAWSGTCALDIDNFEVADKWLAERGVDLRGLLTARNCVQISSGREGRYKLLYLLPEPMASKKLAPYKALSQTTQKEQTYHGFELRCANADGETVQDVLPPTIHPGTGRPYAWAYGDELCGDWRNLPPIPDSLLGIWRESLQVGHSNPVGPTAPAGASLADVDALLAGQDPDCDYDQWIKVGAAVHHETAGSADGLRAWDRWSAKGSKYKGGGDLETHWRSFRANAANAVTLASLRREVVADAAAFPIAEAAPVVEKTVEQLAKEGWEQVRTLLEPRLVFVAGQDNYFDLGSKSTTPWLTDRAVRHLFCPHMPVITQDSKDGKPPKTSKPDPVIFLQNSKSKVVVDAVGLHPGAKRIFREDGMSFVNRYTPFEVKPIPPLPYEEEAFVYLWSRLKDQVFQKWLMQFFAHALQKPGIKIQAAPLLFSAEQGTGKNTICKLIPQRLFGHRWVRTISGGVLRSNFNDTVGETWWLYLEELRSGHTKAERVEITNRIKSWVTDDSIEIHPKGLKPFDIRNRLQITATSNFDDALHIDNNDRRWAVCEMEEYDRNGGAWGDVYKFLNDTERAAGVLHYIFRNVNITGFNPNARAPTTAAKKVMIRAGVGAWESMLIEMMVRGAYPFDKDVFLLRDAYDALVGRGPMSEHALRSVLVKAPFGCIQLPRQSKGRLYAWRNIEQWKKQPESARLAYHTGNAGRPLDVIWSDEVPDDIIAMSADGPPEKTVCDLI